MGKFDYDMLVLGGGAAGLTASKVAFGFGKKVAIIEKEKLGGECTWSGCVPSKALIKAAEVAWYSQRLHEFGLEAPVQKIDTTNVLNFVRERVQAVYQTHTPQQLEKQGIEVIFGDPRFIDKHHVIVGGKKLSAKKFVIATGSSPFIPPIEGLEFVPFLTNKTLFERETLPSSLIILGGGPIGAELASALNRLGVYVTIVEMGPRILPREDEELAVLLQKKFSQDGILIKTQARAIKVARTADGVQLTCAPASDDEATMTFTLRAEALLIATGRKPNIDGLELENAGVQAERRGIVVNKTLRTTASNIYACGDVIGSYQFSHVAWYQAIVAVRNAFIPLFKQRVDYKNVLWITFTAPELASAGLTEKQARDKYGADIKVYKVDYDQIDRGVIDMATTGRGKFVCDKKGRLLGAHILGARAGELIHEAQIAKSLGIKFAKLGGVLHAYPSYSDLVWKAEKQARLDALQNSFFVKIYKRLFHSIRRSAPTHDRRK